MPKLPTCSGREVIRALQRGGFDLHRQRGSHAIMVHRASRRVAVVPVHGGRDVLPETLQGILQQAGLTAQQFRRLLK